MLIHFCEKCGFRVPEKEVASGAARVIDEVNVVCAKCAGGRPSGRVAAPAASSSGELAARRDSRTGITPARGSDQHQGQPAARTSGLHKIPPVLRSAKAPPGPALYPTPTSNSSKMLLYLGAGVGVVVLVLVLVLAAGSGDSGAPAKQDVRKPDDASTRIAAVPPPANTSRSATTTTRVAKAPDEPPVPQPPTPDTKVEEYDPRATIAASLLAQAKALAASDPWAYREKLDELASRYARTAPAEEAAKLLAEWKPPQQQTPPGQDKPRLDGSVDTYLTLKDALSWRCGQSGKALDGRSVDNHPLRIGNKNFERGIGSHSWGEMVYDLGGHYQWLTGYLGVDGEAGNQGSVGYEVWLNGKKTYESGVLRGGREAQYFSVPVKGVHRVKIVVTNGGDNDNFDHADLCNLRVCVSEKEPAEDYGMPTGATIATQTLSEPAKPSDPEGVAQAAYAQFLAGFQALLTQQKWPLARTRLAEALKNPQLASRAETLRLDGELLVLAEKAWQAIPKGATALTDGRHVVLLQTDGKKFEAEKGDEVRYQEGGRGDDPDRAGHRRRLAHAESSVLEADTGDPLRPRARRTAGRR